MPEISAGISGILSVFVTVHWERSARCLCETISQKTRESRREIMQGRISVHREAGCYERNEQ